MEKIIVLIYKEDKVIRKTEMNENVELDQAWCESMGGDRFEKMVA